MNKLLQRILTAACLLLVLVLVLLAAPRPIAIGATGVFMLLAAWEWAAFLGWCSPSRRLAYVGVVAFCMAAALWLVPARVGILPMLLLSLAWWLAAFLWVLRYPTAIPRWLAGIAGILVLVPAWIAMAMLLHVEPGGPALALLSLVIVWAADIGAYFVGRRIGRIKLAPRVSPGKTWEGFVGGLAAAALAAGGGAIILALPVAFMVLVGISVAAISVVGDLTESMFKRSVGAKDSGRMFPGHGGVLDRVDSITAALPLFVLALYWLGKFPA